SPPMAQFRSSGMCYGGLLRLRTKRLRKTDRSSFDRNDQIADMDATSTSVAGVRDIGSNAVALDIESPPDFDAVPGHFLKVTLAVDDERRSRFYTPASPAVGDTFEITVAVEPGGEMGPHLAALEPGDEIEIAGPLGNAHYEGESSVAVLASGPGIGPAVGLAERVLDEGG